MPLDKGCSTDAMSKNIKALVDKEGKPQKQAVAIAYSVLRKACGLQGKEQMTPKQIVAFGKGESVVEAKKAKKPKAPAKKPGKTEMQRADRIVQGIDIALGAGTSLELRGYDESSGTWKVLVSLNDGYLDNLFEKALEANPPGWDDEAGELDVDEDAVADSYSELIAEAVDRAAVKLSENPPFGVIIGIEDAEMRVGDILYKFEYVKAPLVGFGGAD